MVKEIEIKQTVKLPMTKVGKNIICYDAKVLPFILGTAAASGNLHIYNVTKPKGSPTRWIVPIEEIEKRRIMLVAKKEKIERYLEVMEQILKW